MTDLSPEAEDLLKRARESLAPDEARVEAIRAALAARLGPSLPARGPAGGASAKVAGAGTATKLVAVGVLVVVSVAGARILTTRIHGPSPVASMFPAVPAPSSPQRDLPGAPPELAHEVPSVSVDDLPRARPDATTAGRAPLPAPPSRDRDAVEQHPSVVEPLQAPATATVDTALSGEVALLRAAHIALDRGDAARALALLDQYAWVYAHGTLQEESLATRALALCALGRAAEAKEAARRLETLAPRSPHLLRVRASCAGDEERSK